MELHHHYNPYYLNVNPQPEGSGGDQRDRERERDRFPQWSNAETKEFLAVRAELDRSFMETKRNKPLWEAISARLQQKGFTRTPEQCKSKWKNLVTRFKGIEAMEGEGSRQFPFHEEMRTIFSERMERLLVSNKDKGKGVQVQGGDQWGEEEEGEGEEEGEEEDQEEEKSGRRSKKKRKVERIRRGFEEEVENALKEFARRQLEIQARWIASAEAREAERRAKEEEWRRTTVALEEERKAMERTWREKEEERREKEEARAERRDALLTALLAKLEKEGL